MSLRLHLTFFPDELDFEPEGFFLAELACDYCHSYTPEGEEEWLENFRVGGEPMKKWVIDANYDALLALVKRELDSSKYFGDETVLVGGEKYSAALVFGQPAQSFELFRFNTEHERAMFLLGVEAAGGWLRVIPANDAEQEDKCSLKRENSEQYDELIDYLNKEAVND